MKLFKTYEEAVISNGSTKGVYKNEITGEFCHLTGALEGMSAYWEGCEPCDYLETLAAFYARGLKLVKGDKYADRKGNVVNVETYNLTGANTPMPEDKNRFVVKASVYDIENPEEKEAINKIPNQTTIDAMNSQSEQECFNSAFDMLAAIDMTPQQVESLSSSEKPNSSEWKNGDSLLWENGNGEFLECNTGRYIGYDYEDDLHIFVMTKGAAYRVGYAYRDGIKKPETPEEREDRERLEAAYDLYCDFTNSNVVDATCMSSYDFERSLVLPKWLTVVDKTGYRKKEDK